MHSASVSRRSFDACHTKIHDMLKHQLSPAKLETLFSDLNTKFTKHIVNSWGDESGTSTRNSIILILRLIIGYDITDLFKL